jgi:uncharacterized protein YycO
MPQSGDYGVVRTSGAAAFAIRVGTRSPYNHAFVHVGGGRIVEAEPGGAIISPASKYPAAAWSTRALTDAERAAIAAAALGLVGTPYGWPDIAALGFACAGIRSHWIDARIETEHRLICSQLVDRAYLLGGVHLFNDGRLPGEVTPGDLGRLIH